MKRTMSSGSPRGVWPCGLLAAAVLLGGCADVGSPISAARMGQLADIPAPRAPYDADFVEACGTGEVLEAAALARRPYLQQLAPDSAQVLWTSPAPLELVLSTPDGQAVTTPTVRVDDTARPRDGAQYVAQLSELEPATVYCYELRAGERAVTARTGFRTAPEPGSDAAVTFTVVGDMGTGEGDAFKVLEQLKTVESDLLLALGDIAYDDGTLEQFEMHFFDVYDDVLRSIAVFPVSGNHEYHTDDAAAFREVFSLPTNGGEAGHERWYAFDWGQVHFVALDTELIGPEQAAWLENDLANNALPWVVVIGHRPPYSSGHHGSHANFRLTFGPILERYRVPLVLSGHEHNYERTEVINGTTYIVSGGGGKSTRGVGESDFTAFSEMVLHFLWVRVDGDLLELHAIDASGKEFDSVVIRRPQ